MNEGTASSLKDLMDIIDRQRALGIKDKNIISNQEIQITKLASKVDSSRFWMVMTFFSSVCFLMAVFK